MAAQNEITMSSEKPVWPIMACFGGIAVLSLIYMLRPDVDPDEVAVGEALFAIAIVAIAILTGRLHRPFIERLVGSRWTPVALIAAGALLVVSGLHWPIGRTHALLIGLGYPPLAIGVLMMVTTLIRQMR